MGSYRFEILTAEHKSVVIEFLQEDLRISEPTFHSFDMNREDSLPFWLDAFEECTRDPTSVGCFDENNRLIGICLNTILDSGTPIELAGPYTGDLAKIAEYIYVVEKDLFSLESSVKRWLKTDIVGVAKEHRRKGIATELWKRTIELAREHDCRGLTAQSVALLSQEGFKKMGYGVAFELFHDQYLDEDGKQIIKCKDMTKSGQLVLKII